MNEKFKMSPMLRKSIEMYAELLNSLAKEKNVSNEEAVERLKVLGKVLMLEEAKRFENNLINPLHD